MGAHNLKDADDALRNDTAKWLSLESLATLGTVSLYSKEFGASGLQLLGAQFDGGLRHAFRYATLCKTRLASVGTQHLCPEAAAELLRSQGAGRASVGGKGCAGNKAQRVAQASATCHPTDHKPQGMIP